MLRAIPLLSVLALLLSSPSQAALISTAPASLPHATSENASTALFEVGPESRIGLLCHNDPVNKTDPTGLLERDKETRELKATPTGNSMTYGGVKYNEVTLKTNAGNPVSAWKAEKSAPADSKRPTDATSNCHGNTFAGGKYWIQPNQTAQIVEDDGWKPATGAQTSGIGIFVNKVTGEADHSVTITGVDSNGSMTVNSKAGFSPVEKGIPISQAWHDNSAQLIIFTGGGDVYR